MINRETRYTFQLIVKQFGIIIRKATQRRYPSIEAPRHQSTCTQSTKLQHTPPGTETLGIRFVRD